MNHTKKINAGGINQKSMHAVSAVFVNSININVPILRTSNSICRASTCKAFSVYKQSAQCQRPMHTASTTLNSTLTSMHSSSTSMLTVSTASVQNISNQCTPCQQPMTQHQCTEHQQPMCFVSTANVHSIRLPNARFLQNEDFHFLQYASHPCHSARSRRRSRRNHPPRKYPLPECVG